jgi:hypothetical protein
MVEQFGPSNLRNIKLVPYIKKMAINLDAPSGYFFSKHPSKPPKDLNIDLSNLFVHQDKHRPKY